MSNVIDPSSIVPAEPVESLRETLFKTEDEIGAETLALHFFATEIGHKNVQILLKLAQTLA